MNPRLLFVPGILAGLVFFSAVFALAPFVDGYSHVSRTVSEIGRAGSPVELAWQIAMIAVALCLLAFAWGLYRFAGENGLPKLPAWFMAFFAVSELGLAAFPTPHQLHNVFGLSLTIGYMTPLVLALSWRRLESSRRLIGISWLGFLLVAAAIFLNLSPLFARDLYPLEYYGLVQRSLFVAFFGWCLLAGLALYARK